MIHEDDCTPRYYAACKVLHDSYRLVESDALDAAYDSIRAAVQAEITEYRLRIANERTSATERAVLLIRIDTLKKFGDA